MDDDCVLPAGVGEIADAGVAEAVGVAVGAGVVDEEQPQINTTIPTMPKSIIALFA
jgi:hypothetical protein